MERPIIGLTCMHGQWAAGGTVIAVRPSYLRALEAAGAVPLLIHLTDDLAVVRALYERCGGILLPGGDDIDPAHFGEGRHPMLGAVDPRRDHVELAVARWCRADGKPLLGICRGIQVLNVAFGGSLWQDIPSQLPGSLDHHQSTRLKQYAAEAHRLTLDPGSWLARQLDAGEVAANTMHHQAVKDVAPGLRVVGHAPDGVIEAVEGAGEHFVVGVQCHPEHLWQEAEPRWRRFFAGFVEVCG